MALKVLENLFAAWPLLVFFLCLMAAIFARKTHRQAPRAVLTGLLEQLVR